MCSRHVRAWVDEIANMLRGLGWSEEKIQQEIATNLTAAKENTVPDLGPVPPKACSAP